MKIALVCPYDWNAPGGVQVHVRQLGDRLISRGHEVLGMAPGTGGTDVPWMTLVSRPIRIPYSGTVAPVSPSPHTMRRIRSRLRAFDPDVVHVHEPTTPSTSMYAALNSPAPVVATFHAYLDGSRLLGLAKPMLSRVMARVSVAIAVSEAAASFSVRRFGREPLIIPNGVEVERFSDAEPSAGAPTGQVVLWVNRLDPQKGFRVAVRAFDHLARQFQDAQLVVAGDGSDRAAIDELPPDILERVTMLGTVAHEELPGWFASADVFVSPALGQESFGIVLVEAMAAGLPVVATDIPGYREVLRPDAEGLLVPAGNPIALANAVRRILLDPSLSSRYSSAGRARAGAFSWSRVLPELEAAYDRALSG